MERTAKPTLMTVQITLAKMEDHASTKLTHTSVYAEFRSLVEIVSQKWTRVRPINVVTEHDAHQVLIIRTFTVHARSVMQEDCAMKTSTNVNFHHLHAEMERPAKTQTVLINAFARKVTKGKIVQLTPTTALHFRAKTVELVSTESEITLACVTMALKENTVK